MGQRPARPGHGQAATHHPAAAFRLMVLHLAAPLAGVYVQRDQRLLQGKRPGCPPRGHVIAAIWLRHASPHHAGHSCGMDAPDRADKLGLPASVTPAHTSSGATPGVVCVRPECCQPGQSPGRLQRMRGVSNARTRGRA